MLLFTFSARYHFRFNKVFLLLLICTQAIYGVAQKWHSFFWYAFKFISSNINRFSKLFHCQNQETKESHHTSNVLLHYLVKCQVSSKQQLKTRRLRLLSIVVTDQFYRGCNQR